MLSLPSIAVRFFVGLGCAATLLTTSCSRPASSPPSVAEWTPDSTSVRLAAGPQYDRGAVWCFFWGAHYRHIWATPVTVPVLRLATALPGGLAPIQAGGSYQSHTLRLCAANGQEFVLRSVDKDASAALPAGWKRRLLGGLMKDQTSAANPYGAYVVARLAGAVGVYHANPRLVYVGNDPALGKFRAAYANALYLLEERAERNQASVASFGRSTAVVSTARMLADIRKYPTSAVDARAYLRARLLDVWVGDWSRREDQWRWASFRNGGRVTYRPIPRDRDQAFFLFNDGAVTRLVSWFMPKYHSFGPALRPRDVQGLTTTARVLDRTLLGALSAEDFRQISDSLRQRLSDAVIARALQAGPAETQATIAATYGPSLRERREQLPVVAARFYEILSAEAWLIGTDQAERFVVNSVGAGRLQVRVLAMQPGRPDSLLSQRVYDRHDTYRLSVFGLAGNDIFELKGPVNPGFAVHLYDGAGRDHVLSTGAQPNTSHDVTWYSSSDGNSGAKLSSIRIRPDRDSAQTSNYRGWLMRYNLRD